MLFGRSQSNFRVIAFVPSVFHMHVRNIVSSDSAPDMHHHRIQLILLQCAREGEFGRIDDVVSELDQAVVFVAEAFEVKLNKELLTSRMLGGT